MTVDLIFYLYVYTRIYTSKLPVLKDRYNEMLTLSKKYFGSLVVYLIVDFRILRLVLGCAQIAPNIML